MELDDGWSQDRNCCDVGARIKFRRLAFGLARSSVRSDTGVEIRVGIPFVTYSEGGRVVKVGRELAFRALGPSGKKKAYWLVALKAPMCWESPHSDEELTPEKREQIETTIKAALDFLKIEYEVY
jgi:hypothetical protein